MVVNAIAARTNVRRLLFGTVDFCLDLGVEGDGEGLDHYRAMLVLTSRAAGLQPPVDGVTLALKDEPASRVATLRAKPAGFGGKLCVHPSQVPTANGGLQPTAGEVEWATQVLALAMRSAGAGVGPSNSGQHKI